MGPEGITHEEERLILQSGGAGGRCGYPPLGLFRFDGGGEVIEVGVIGEDVTITKGGAAFLLSQERALALATALIGAVETLSSAKSIAEETAKLMVLTLGVDR